MRKRILALTFFAAWFLMGAIIGGMIAGSFVIASLGGVFEPPAIWKFARDLGITVLPFLLMFGGVPAAIQIWRGRRWEPAAAVSFIICGISCLVLIVVVKRGPELFGWTW